MEDLIKKFTEALKSKKAEEREWAAYALGDLKAKTALRELLKASQDSTPFVRAGVAYALGEIEDDKTIPYLNRLAKDSDEFVRMVAARALGRKTSKVIKWLLDIIKQEKSSIVKIEAIKSISKFKEPLVKRIMIRLSEKDKNPYVRLAALNMLKEFDLVESDFRKIKHLARSDPYPYIRAKANEIMLRNFLKVA